MADTPTQVRRHVTLPLTSVTWLEETYGPNNLSWALGCLLDKFAQAHKTSPVKLAELAAEALKYQIEDSLEQTQEEPSATT